MGELCKCLGIQRALSTAYHPQTDGQTEQMNQEIKAFLRHYVNYKQDNWANWIAEAEFQYNNKQYSTTGFSPFYLNYGCHLWKGDENRSTTILEVQRFTEELDKARRKAQQAIDRRNKELKTKINKGRKTETYTNGDKVWLEAKNFNTEQRSAKLDNKRYGPFKVTRAIGHGAYKLKLPTTWMTHNVFNENLLTQ